MVKSINETLNEARNILKEKNIDEREARLLLAFSLEIKVEKLLLKKECSLREYSKYMQIINKRASGIPYAYIVGHKEFMKLDFEVNKNVLIPREDTEILVQEVINLNKKKILDMCTGSGCIAISLAKYIKDSEVTAVDISEKALTIAKLNAKKNEVDVKFIKSNLFEEVEDKFDVIVSNPPYIKTADLEALQTEVKNEPMKALDGGETGLFFYKKIIKQAVNYLNENGILIFEIGFDQAEDVCKLLNENGFKDIEVIKDLSGNDRVIKAKLVTLKEK